MELKETASTQGLRGISPAKNQHQTESHHQADCAADTEGCDQMTVSQF